MKKLTCKLNFKDGSSIVVKAASESADAQVSMELTGPSRRLGPVPDKGSLGFIEWYFQARALHLGAEFVVTTEGDYARQV